MSRKNAKKKSNRKRRNRKAGQRSARTPLHPGTSQTKAGEREQTSERTQEESAANREPEQAPERDQEKSVESRERDSAGQHFSKTEEEFFAAGDALATTEPEPCEDFSDLDPVREKNVDSWVRRALATLAQVRSS